MQRWLVFCLVCACGSRQPDPSVPQDKPIAAAKLPDKGPFAAPGEHMSYRLQLGQMELASFDLAVGDVTEIAGKQAIVVQAHAKAAGLVKMVTNIDDTLTSWIDVATGRPLLWTVDEFAVRGTDKERTEARIHARDGDTIPIEFHVNDDPPSPEPQKVSMPDVWDLAAFLIALRGWEAPSGSTVDAEVLRSRFLWHVHMTVHGKEKIVTELGDFPSLRFDGITYKLGRDGKRIRDMDERHFSIWVSDDADRVPLECAASTDYGDIKLKLIDYQPGTRRK